ncbi:VacJ protein [Candidatus Terasakiella magnetica]|nr:VacJ protein [Candidatus Terasakiella magnetica]
MDRHRLRSKTRIQKILAAAMLICGLVTPVSVSAADDPLETFNRAMFDFNKGLLANVINPTVDYLGPRTPQPVKTALGNAYSNLTEIEFILNGALRRDLGEMAIPAKRFAINSTLGVAGIFDVAKSFGIERHESDFIESLCRLGVAPGPYLVLPLVGSANLNSAAMLSGAIALEVYALSFISTPLATADFVIIDMGGTAAALRYMNTMPDAQNPDPYQALRTDHMNYVSRSCGGTSNP